LKRWVGWLVLAPLASACSLVTEPEEDLTQRPPVLFEIEYVNLGFTRVWRGHYVDATGNVYAYDRSRLGQAPGQQTDFTHAQLMDKYNVGRVHVRTLSTAELQPISLLIPAAAQAQLPAPEVRCADAGVLSFRAYIFDHQAAVFRPVAIRMEGDQVQANPSEAAGRILQYLDGLGLAQHIEGCEP
jgi:hypothetical protein